MDVLLLRLDAPLMSFGGVVVDEHNPTDPLPYRAMLAGLVANALGLTRAQEREFESLQSRIRYAARRDRRGEPLVDYQRLDDPWRARGAQGGHGERRHAHPLPPLPRGRDRHRRADARAPRARAVSALRG
jgi:CRISPR-associated protein Cas5/CasD subtype I-E